MKLATGVMKKFPGKLCRSQPRHGTPATLQGLEILALAVYPLSLRWLAMAPKGTDDQHVVLATFHDSRVVAQHSTALFVTTAKQTFGLIQRAAVGNADDLRNRCWWWR